jgi:hypothetical protein
MAYYDLAWYCNAGDQATTGHYAVAKRASGAAVVAGQLCRQFTAPAVGSERIFVCIIAGTTAVATDATWVLTRGAKTVDGTVTWMEVTGIAAVNGDKTNTINWTAAKAIGVPTLGTIIQRNNGASYQICTTAGTLGAAEPAFSDTAGVTTTETSATTVWTSLGPVTNFTGGQAPHARLANAGATNWFATNNTIYVGDNHAESQATAITTGPTSITAGINKILCHNHAGSYPPAASDLTTGATVTTTAAANINIGASGGAQTTYMRGLTFQAGSGASTNAFVIVNSAANGIYLDNCSLQVLTTAAASTVQLGAVGAQGNVILNNTTLKFNNVGQSVALGGAGNYVWQGTAPALASGSLVPNSLLAPNVSGLFATFSAEAVDLSAIAGNLVLFGLGMNGSILFKDCKLNAAAAIPTPLGNGSVIQLVRSSS